MGYTHYFPQEREFTQKEWTHITAAVKTLLTNRDDVAGGDGECEPQIDDMFISFNGKDEEGCETLEISRKLNTQYNFCKTRNRAYDPYVVATLCICEHYAPGALKISSDGNVGEWEEGRQLASKILKVTCDVPEGVR